MPKNPTARLRLASPAAPPHDDRAEVARALLTRYVPVEPVVSDTVAAFLGWDAARFDRIERDPRYLIGRLTQALTALLEQEVPPPDATGQLLTEAIRDAITYRRHDCACEAGCPACQPDWLQAARYESLYGQLGLIGELPVPHPRPKAVGR